MEPGMPRKVSNLTYPKKKHVHETNFSFIIIHQYDVNWVFFFCRTSNKINLVPS